VINVEWATIEKNLLKWVFGHQWTRIDFLVACQQARQMVASQPHTVKIVVDISASQVYPSRVIHLALAGMRLKTSNTGQIVVISPSNLWLRLYQYMQRAYKFEVLPVEFVGSHYDAMKRLDMPFFVGGWDDAQKLLPAYSGHSTAPFYQL
jgi:hypothetical protein